MRLSVFSEVSADNMPPSMPWRSTFALRPLTQNAPMPADTQDGVALVTISSDNPGAQEEYTASFDEITYTEEGSFVYDLREIDDPEDYFSGDGEAFTITVDVTVQEGNVLSADVSYSLRGRPVDRLQFTDHFLEEKWHDDMSPPKGSIRLNLIDADTGAPLPGAVFSVYYDPGCSMFYGSMPETGSSGESILPDIMPGTYYVRESKPSPGHGIDHGTFEVQVHAGDTSQVNDGNPIENIPGNGSIILTEIVEDAISAAEFPFVIRLTGADVSNVYLLQNDLLLDDVSRDLSDDGEALAYLRHGDRLEIAALPAATAYHISSVSDDPAYMTSINGQQAAVFSGTIDGTAPVQADFVSMRSPDMPTQEQIDAMPVTGDQQNMLPWCLLLAAASSLLLLLRRRSC